MKWTGNEMTSAMWLAAWTLVSVWPVESVCVSRVGIEQVVNVRTHSGRYGQLFLVLPREGERPKVEFDTANLKNGDRVSGVIESISRGLLILRSELLPSELRIPVENIREILFRDKEANAPLREAIARFINGDCLSIDLRRYEQGTVVAETDLSSEVQIKREHVAGIVFRQKPRVIYRSAFEAGDASGFRSLVGEWSVSDGKFGPQEGSRWSGAYLRLRQEGQLKFTWTIGAGRGRAMQAGFLFFAQAPDHNAPGDAYQVQVSGDSLYIYRTIQNVSQHLATVNMSSRRKEVTLEAEYDPGSGAFRLSADGEEVVRGLFSSPIVRGEYIVLLPGSDRERFHNIVVEQVGGGVLHPPEGQKEEGDFLFLANGDRLSGEVAAISEGKVRLETGYCGEPLELPLGDVLSLGFGGASRNEDGKMPRIAFRNGDQLSGEMISLVEGKLRVRTPYLGDVELDANAVSGVVLVEDKGSPGMGDWNGDGAD